MSSFNRLSLEQLEQDIRLCEQYLSNESKRLPVNDVIDDINEQHQLEKNSDDNDNDGKHCVAVTNEHIERTKQLQALLAQLKERNREENLEFKQTTQANDDKHLNYAVLDVVDTLEMQNEEYDDNDDDDDDDDDRVMNDGSIANDNILFDASTGEPYDEDKINSAVMISKHSKQFTDSECSFEQTHPDKRSLNNYTIPLEFSLSAHCRTPHTSSKPCRRRVNTNTMNGRTSATTIHERIDMWTHEKKQKYEIREAQRRQKENKELTNCTFRPHLPTRSKSFVTRCTQNTRQREDKELSQRHTQTLQHKHKLDEVSQRLCSRASAMVETRERMRRERNAIQTRELKFKPKVGARSRQLAAQRARKTADNRPLHERVADVQRRREALQLMYAREDEQESYRPFVSVRSRRLAERRKRIDGASAASAADTRVLEQLQRHQKVIDSVHEECPFKPEMNANSVALLERMSDEIPRNFMERQRVLNERGEAMREALRVEKMAQETPTFRRSSLDKNAVMMLHTSSSSRVDDNERLQRLVYEDAERRREAQLQTEENHYAQFAFAPKINTHSRRLVERQRRSTHNTSNQAMAHTSHQRVVAQLEAEFTRACSFKPELSRGSARSKGVLGFASGEGVVARRVEEYQVNKSAKLASARRMLVEREMSECSFRPLTSSSSQTLTTSRKAETKSVVVRGLDRFLELKQAAQRLKAEQADREARAFGRKLGAARQSVTVPLPFDLSCASEQQRNATKRLRGEHQRRMQIECTFRPDTQSKRNRDLIMKILDDDDDDDDKNNLENA